MHDFRERLLRGEQLIGTMLTLTAPAVAEILALIGSLSTPSIASLRRPSYRLPFKR